LVDVADAAARAFIGKRSAGDLEDDNAEDQNNEEEEEGSEDDARDRTKVSKVARIESSSSVRRKGFSGGGAGSGGATFSATSQFKNCANALTLRNLLLHEHRLGLKVF
jgi:hypothetical protein